MASYNDDVYFAAYERNDPRYLDALLNKIDVYREYLQSSGKLSRWQRSLQNYYGVSSDGTKASGLVTRGGDQGQLTMVKVNDYRNLVQHQLILITSQRPAGEAKAINSDPESLKSARIGSMLVEYYLTQVGYEQKLVLTGEKGLVVDEAYCVLDWDAMDGDEIRPEIDDETGEKTGRMVMTGDQVLRAISPWNLARDPYITSPDDMKWGIYSFRVNKFDLASKFPNYKDEILSSSGKTVKELPFDKLDSKSTDQTTVHVLAHEPTLACNQGRYTWFIPDAVLLDGDFPYAELNIYRFAQNDSIDSSFGYTNNNDILGIEEVTDALYSVCVSNQTAFGGQAIIGPKGANLDHTQFGKGFAYFEVEPQYVDKIKPLQLTKTAPEIFNFIGQLSTKKETLAGINSVVRGDPDGALRSNSGSAMALIQAQSIQFNSGGQRSWYQLLSKVGTGMILMFQKYADEERIIRITGKVQGQYLEEFKFSKETLKPISSVTFEMVNPIEQTIGGKQAFADNMLAKNMIKNPRQYLTVSRTGSLDAFLEDDEADEIGLKSENAWLREGKPVEPIWTENHEEHIQAHQSLISSPEQKSDPNLVATVQDHIQKHLNLWQQYSMTNPGYLIATKQKVLPPPPPPPGMMPPPGMQGPGGPPPQPPPPHGGPTQNPEHMMAPQSPAERQAGAIKPPQQPKQPMNPLTGQRGPGSVG